MNDGPLLQIRVIEGPKAPVTCEGCIDRDATVANQQRKIDRLYAQMQVYMGALRDLGWKGDWRSGAEDLERLRIAGAARDMADRLRERVSLCDLWHTNDCGECAPDRALLARITG